MKQVVVTGIKPTGTPHIGNYFGAIKQAIEMSKNDDYIRFNCNIDKCNYSKLLKLQKYYSRLFNKKITLTETFIICIQSECENNLEDLKNITLDYEL